VGLTTISCKKKIVEKPPRNSAGFCGGGRGLSWAVVPRKERKYVFMCRTMVLRFLKVYFNAKWTGSEHGTSLEGYKMSRSHNPRSKTGIFKVQAPRHGALLICND
jgi:hypothetical protein